MQQSLPILNALPGAALHKGLDIEVPVILAPSSEHTLLVKALGIFHSSRKSKIILSPLLWFLLQAVSSVVRV